MKLKFLQLFFALTLVFVSTVTVSANTIISPIRILTCDDVKFEFRLVNYYNTFNRIEYYWSLNTRFENVDYLEIRETFELDGRRLHSFILTYADEDIKLLIESDYNREVDDFNYSTMETDLLIIVNREYSFSCNELVNVDDLDVEFKGSYYLPFIKG